MPTEINLKIINFFKTYWKKILIILAVWAVVIVINYFVGKYENENLTIDTNYKPHESIMDNGDVPEELRDPISELIGKFVENCNNKDYEAAYNLLSEECRNNVYANIEDFKLYVDYVFPNKKIYNIQNFSNKGNIYVYTVTILDDILATGFNDEENAEYYEEKYVIKNDNGKLQLSIREYIGRDNLTYMYEDEYMKIKVESVDKKYDSVTYTLSIANKADKTIVYSDYSEDYEIALDTSEGMKRRADQVLEPIIVKEGETKYYTIKYTIFFDEDTEINGLLFDYIRIFDDMTAYENGDEPIKDFSVNIKF